VTKIILPGNLLFLGWYISVELPPELVCLNLTLPPFEVFDLMSFLALDPSFFFLPSFELDSEICLVLDKYLEKKIVKIIANLVFL
jgi:hypothetical protein